MNPEPELMTPNDLATALAAWLESVSPEAAPAGLRDDVMHATAGVEQRRRGWLNPEWLDSRRRRHALTMVSLAAVSLVAITIFAAAAVLLILSAPPPSPAAPVTPAGDMASPRSYHTATLLADGRVLIIGGTVRSGSLAEDVETLATAELWDPRSRTFTPAGTMAEPRVGHTATLLPDGRVLVAGGRHGAPSPSGNNQRDVRLASVEIWDPRTLAFSAAPPLSEPRSWHTATALPDGRVLISGGLGGPYTYIGVGLTTAEIWDPAANAFIPSGELTVPRAMHTATALADGRVLLTGGYSFADGSSDEALDSSEIWDPTTGKFSATGSMSQPRADHAAALLADGRVLVVGDPRTAQAGDRDTAEAWDPGSGTFAPAGRPEHESFYNRGSQIVVLDDGRVVYVGAAPEILAWLPDDATFEIVAELPEQRDGYTLTRLRDGRVLLAGGAGVSFPGDRGSALASAVLFDPLASPEVAPSPSIRDAARGAYRPGGSISTSALLRDGVATSDDSALMVGAAEGEPGVCSLASTPFSFSWRAGRAVRHDMAGQAPDEAAVAALRDGRVLVVGSSSDSDCVAHPSTVLWDPETGTTQNAGEGRFVPSSPTLVRMADDRVLVIGGIDLSAGEDGGSHTQPIELWYPATLSFADAGGLVTPRQLFTATALADGRVLIVGGSTFRSDCPPDAASCEQRPETLSTAELWDPATHATSPAGAMAVARHDHSATLLADGRVLIVGGFADADRWQPELSAEIWDPSTNTFAYAGTLPDQRPGHSATLLADGSVLIAGGSARPSLTWDPASGWFTDTASMLEPRLYQLAVPLGDDTVLLAGGLAFDPMSRMVESVEVYAPTAP